MNSIGGNRIKKRMKPLSRKTVLAGYFAKDKNLKKRIEAGVLRLKIVAQIIDLREKLGITQAELARRIGVSQPFIARIESDEASN